ncbi:hypothetical protein [Nocardia wallacei]|uniref:hypothetical protein n=1 Tax=Nocardia wallacei TaxID=480035 RepID=UPI0024546EB4|nr:hypothetical protein [Nocardia wallacei]
MVWVVAFLVSVASARVKIWRSRSTRLYTLALASVAAGYACSAQAIGDTYIDPVLPEWMGHNISDMLRSVGAVISCWLIGLMFLRLMQRFPSPRSRLSPVYRYARYRWAWSAYSLLTLVAVVVLSRLSDAARVPADGDMTFRDPAGVAYVVIYFTQGVVTCLFLVYGGVIGWMRSNDPVTRGMMVAFAGIGVSGVGVAVWVAWWLTTAPMVGHPGWMDRISPPFLIALGLIGLVGLGRRCWISRSGSWAWLRWLPGGGSSLGGHPAR